MAAFPQKLQLLLLCLLALDVTHCGVPLACALDSEEGGQKNILQGFSKDEPTGQEIPLHLDLALTQLDPVLDIIPQPEAKTQPEEELDSKELLVVVPLHVPSAGDKASSPATNPTLPTPPVLHKNSSEEEAEDNIISHGPACDEAIPPETIPKIARGLLRLGADLLKELEQEDSRSNIIFSPLSVGLALAHLSLGAANQTEKKLLGVLHAESVPCLHQALHQISQHLRETALSLAGRIYLEKGFPVKEKFLEDSERFYSAKPATLSGNSQADLEAINSWVKEATHGQIPSLLSDLPANIVMVLLNAVHFQGFWKTKFDPLLTEPSTFYLDEEFMVSVEMMKAQIYPLSWFTADSLDAQVARFPFKGNTSFVAVIPNRFEGNFSQLLGQLHAAHLHPPFPKEKPTMVKMPKLHLRYHQDLNQALSRLGLGELFSSPNFQPMADGPLLVSSIQHQSALELAEDGVEASAATSVAMSRSLSAFHLNRPFFFFIFDDVSSIPLFLGTIRNPNPSAPLQRKTDDCGQADSKEPSPPCGVNSEKP